MKKLTIFLALLPCALLAQFTKPGGGGGGGGGGTGLTNAVGIIQSNSVTKSVNTTRLNFLNGTDIFTLITSNSGVASLTPLIPNKTGTGGLVGSNAPIITSPSLLGNPTAPTATTGDSDTSIASTAFVNASTTASNLIAASNGVTVSVSGPGWGTSTPSSSGNRQNFAITLGSVLGNLSALSDTSFTNVTKGGTNISVRAAGGTNFIDTAGQLNNWALFQTNTMNSNSLNAVLNFGSNQVQVAAGANITVTPSGSGGVMTYTVAGSAGGSGSTNNTALNANTFLVTNNIISPWHAGVVSSVLYASNGMSQFTTLSADISITYAPLSGSDASNALPVTLTVTQNGTGGYFVTFNGYKLPVRTNANAISDIVFGVRNGQTNAGTYPVLMMTNMANGQVMVWDATNCQFIAAGNVNISGTNYAKSFRALVGGEYAWDGQTRLQSTDDGELSVFSANGTSPGTIKANSFIGQGTSQVTATTVQGAHKSSDGTAGATITTGGATFKDGLITSGTITGGSGATDVESNIVVSTTNNVLIDFAAANVFRLQLLTNWSLTYTNTSLVTNYANHHGMVYFLQDTNGTRLLNNYKVAGGLLLTNANMQPTTNASALDVLEVIPGFWKTNLIAWWPQNFLPRVGTTNSLSTGGGGGANAFLTSLAAYWKLDEASGTRVDSTANAQDLTDNNTVLSAAGKINNAGDFEFDNVEYLSHADSATLSLGADTDFTISCWVSLESYTGLDGGIVVKGGSSGTYDNSNEYQLLFDGSSSDRITLNVGNGSANATVTANNFGSPPKNGTLFFVVAWHDSTADTLNIQINNGTVDSAAWSGGTQDGTGAFHIGARVANTGFAHDGLIDEVGFWKRVLTTQERTDLYNSGAGLPYSSFQ